MSPSIKYTSHSSRLIIAEDARIAAVLEMHQLLAEDGRHHFYISLANICSGLTISLRHLSDQAL